MSALPKPVDLELEAERPSYADVQLRKKQLSNRARLALKHPTLVYEVWGLLWKACVNDEERAALRDGHVRLEDFDDAVRIVRESAECSATGSRSDSSTAHSAENR